MRESGEHTLNISGFLGSTSVLDTDSVTVAGSVTRRFTSGPHWIEPAVNVIHTKLDNDAFTDSRGRVTAASTQKFGSLSYGASIGTTIAGDGTVIQTIRPSASIFGIDNYEHPDDSVIALTGAVFEKADSGFSIGGGVELVVFGGMTLGVSGSHSEYDTALEGSSYTASLSAPLSIFGNSVAPQTASISLAYIGNGSSAGAKGRITIPFD